MKSFIAALRTLVLPFGATTGRRIVLDGVNGQIILFDVDNKERINIGRQDDTIELFSGADGEDDPGTLLTVVLNSAGANRRGGTRITSPQFASTSDSESSISLYSEAFDGTIQPDIEYVADTHSFEASPPGTGAAIVLDNNGTISVPDSTADILIGNGVIDIEAGGDIQIDNLTLPRGTVGFAQNVATVALSTTAGTYTTIVEDTTVPVISGRRYKISYLGCDNLLIAGAGFATTNQWYGKFQVDISGGGYADLTLTPANQIARLEVAATTRKPVPVVEGIYVASATDAACGFRFQAAKTVGAAGVTSQLEGSHTILVEDIGV